MVSMTVTTLLLLAVAGFGAGLVAQPSFFAPLEEAGIGMCWFSPRWGRRYLLRNHQKRELAMTMDQDERL